MTVAFSQDAKLFFVCVNLYFHTDGAKQIGLFISWAIQIQIFRINWSCIKEGSGYFIRKAFGEIVKVYSSYILPDDSRIKIR